MCAVQVFSYAGDRDGAMHRHVVSLPAAQEHEEPSVDAWPVSPFTMSSSVLVIVRVVSKEQREASTPVPHAWLPFWGGSWAWSAGVDLGLGSASSPKTFDILALKSSVFDHVFWYSSQQLEQNRFLGARKYKGGGARGTTKVAGRA